MSQPPKTARRRASDRRRGRPVEPVAAGPVGIADMLHAPATARTRMVAGVFVAVFLALTLLAARFGSVAGPELRPLLPISATLWGAAELLTAYLLLTQFAVNGVRAFLVLGSAYAITGLLTIPYLIYFPGLFGPAQVSLGDEQVSASLWLVWHFTFPVLIGLYIIADRQLVNRVVDTAEIRGNLTLTVLLIFAVALSLVGLVNFDHSSLPIVVNHGHFTKLWTHTLAPAVVILNTIAALLVAFLSRRASRLQTWIAVALMTSAMDGLLNAFSPGRFTLSWYLGKIETLTTATIILGVLLSEVGAMYRRLGTMAMLDALTGLRNRRAFDDYLRWVLQQRRHKPSEMAFLVVDVDYFKLFNDRYGHAAGDVALRRVADSVVESLHREFDVAARFGGEEFVVLLPETGAKESERVAERIRLGVESMRIAHSASSVYHSITVSIGVAYVEPEQKVDAITLFAIADRALYKAKERRNMTVVVAYEPVAFAAEEAADPAPPVLAAAAGQ